MNRSRKGRKLNVESSSKVLVRADVILSQRLAKAWSQQEAAKRLRISERLLRTAEKGGPISIQSLEKIAYGYKVPVEVLHSRSAIEDDSPDSICQRASEFLLQVWNHRNFDVIATHLLPEFSFHHEKGVVSNREEMRERIIEFQKSFSDFDFVIDETRSYGQFIVCRWHVSMTHTGPWADLAPTGRRGKVFGSSWVQVVGDRFGDAWDFWDPELLYHQLAESS